MTENKKIVIVCGYPKSGTTWCTRLIAQLIGCPADGYWDHEGAAYASEGFERESEFICYKTHQSYDELSHHKLFDQIFRIVYVVRDPRDVVVSGSHHFNFSRDWIRSMSKNSFIPSKLISFFKLMDKSLQSKVFRADQMINMLMHGNSYIAHSNYVWSDHINSYLGKPKVKLVRYEDLLADGLKNCREVLEHVGLKKTDSLIQQDLAEQSFSRSKKRYELAGDLEKARHLRKGVSGDWSISLNKKQVGKIDTAFQSTMKLLGYL